MKTKPEWLREFADAMEADPSGWWQGFEHGPKPRDFNQEWVVASSGGQLLQILEHGHPIRRKPRTVTRFDRNGERVELPGPMRERPEGGDLYWSARCGQTESRYWGIVPNGNIYFALGNCFATQADAQAWADYFRSLLENRDE